MEPGDCAAFGRSRGISKRQAARASAIRPGVGGGRADGRARRLETLYLEKQAAREADALPVPDLANLDVYYEIGAELDIERANHLDDEAYVAAYLAKLSDWNRREPLPADSRLLTARGGVNQPS